VAQPPVARPLPLRLVDNLRAETREFKAAVLSAPEPKPGFDVLGLRRWIYKVGWRLLHEHDSPRELALATFLGVIIGSTPLYGAHLVMCLLVAFTLRLNKLVMWLGANVSLPIFAPFLGLASAQVGHLILHGQFGEMTVATMREVGVLGGFKYWLVGSPVVGSVLGLVLGALVYVGARKRRAGTEAA